MLQGEIQDDAKKNIRQLIVEAGRNFNNENG